MPKKTVYEPGLISISSPSDGARHLAISVIKRAQADLSYLPSGEKRRELRSWLANDAWYWAVLAGGEGHIAKQALLRRYAHS